MIGRLNRKGTAAAEFALVIPVLLILIFGTLQAGVLFYANAGLKNGVGEAARLATLWPRRTTGEITTQFRTMVYGIDRGALADPVITTGRSQGSDYVEITATYTVPLDLFFVPLPSVTLTERRRAFLP